MTSAMDQRVMSSVAAGLASRCGVKVTVSGTGAYSTLQTRTVRGRTVEVPEINIPAEIRKPTPEAMVLMRGYLDHEAAHVRWSDWDAVRAAQNAGGAFLKSMLNVVEDVRIERLMGAAFSGARENLRDIAVLLFGGDRWKEQLKALAGRPKRAAASLALSWALYRMRSMDVPELKPGLDVLSKVLDAVRPKTRAAMEKELDGWLRTFGWPDSTAKALDLAGALARAFFRTGKDGQDLDVQEAADTAAQAMADAGLGESGARFLGEEAARAAGRQAEDSACATGRSSAADRQQLDNLLKDAPGLGQLGDAVNRELDRLDPEQCAGEDASRHELSAFLPKETALAEGILEPWAPEDLAWARRLCSGLGQRLASLLQTSARTMKGTGRSGRRLDSSVLWRAGARDGRVFRTQAQRQSADAAVLVLVDASGSMCGACCDLASAAMLSVLEALDQVKGVQAGAAAFSAAGGTRLVHAVVRAPGDRTPAAMLPRTGAGGGTEIAGSMLHCASLLPDAPRRIMLVVSDGEDVPRTVRAAERELAERGILVAGVSVMSDMLMQGLSRCTKADSPDEIPAAVFGALQDVLLHGSGA